MAKISKKQVKHVAKLARLGLTKKEIEKFQKQLSAILEYMDLLNEVNTEGIEPTSQTTGLENVFRPDKAKRDNSLTQKEALANAPDKKDGYINVKKIL